jgi:ribosome-associated translation inhibitor RaiA
MIIMIIQINADHNLKIHAAFRDKLKDLLAEELDRFSEQTTRLEMHLSDVNGNKDGLNDKRCLIEARVQGREPIVATDLADTYEQAVSGAIEKLKAALESKLSKLKSF